MTHDGVAVLTVGFDVLFVFGRRLMPASGQERSSSVHKTSDYSLGFVTNILAVKIAVLAQGIGDR